MTGHVAEQSDSVLDVATVSPYWRTLMLLECRSLLLERRDKYQNKTERELTNLDIKIIYE